MNTFKPTHAALLIAAFALVGCSVNPPQQSSAPTPSYSQSNSQTYGQSNSRADGQSNATRYGVIDAIDAVQQANNPSGAGLVVGGLVGGLLGTQVGGGRGKTAATVVGAIGGAVVGNNIEQNRTAQSPEHYQIHMRMDNGDRLSVMQDSVADLRIGDRVRLVDSHVYRD